MKKKTLPTTLRAPGRQKKRARELAERHLKKATRAACFPRIQGMFSLTVIVTFQDHTEGVVQFRYEPLDPEPFRRARAFLGELVPTVEILEDEELQAADLWPVYLSYISGITWFERMDRWTAQHNVLVAKSLGRVLSRGVVLGGTSEGVIESEILPRLRALLESGQEVIQPFAAQIQRLVDDAHQVNPLPLQLAHLDLNELNIIVDEEGEVTGLIDWERSPPPMPFGMRCSRIHTLPGEYQEGKYSERKEYQEMERGFWEDMVGHAPAAVLPTLRGHPEAVQISFLIGTVLEVLETEVPGRFHQASLRALPKFLTYRIPALRGPDPPFAL
ncbi:MAG: hypothetical protein M1826_003805 [Phylliscum demangeonii]|nr:MAG: hypothetical protein M1826_003805 [Phylliscum demangeonii]